MIDRNYRLALTKQAALLGICRGSVYYEPAPVSDADLALMRRLDELHPTPIRAASSPVPNSPAC
jgi:putative transposase